MSAGPSIPAHGGQPLPPRLRPRSGYHRAPSFAAALGLTLVNAVLPGTGFLAAGRRKLGAATLLVFLALIAGGVWLATGGMRFAARTFVDQNSLLIVLGVVAVLAVAWIAVIVAGYRMLVPRTTPAGRHVVGALVVAAMVAVIAVPAVYLGRVALTQRDLIADVFTGGESATVDEESNPFGGERVNVLLLGGDGGEGREGIRTDTVIVASIDTGTGDTVLFSLPRNLEDLPFPEGSPLHERYPEGYEDQDQGLLNAIYRNAPEANPDILGPTDHPGADILKIGVGEALGLDIHYFVLVNLEGFSRLVDALGGITVNVNYWVPIGGEPTLQIPPDDWMRPGPDQHLDGTRALDFARGRYNLTDYDRMDRQRCAIAAIIDAADPLTVLRQYRELANTAEDIVETDIPSSVLDDFVDVGFRVKNAEVRSVVFDTHVIDPAYPEYDRMRQTVAETLAPPPAPSATGGDAPGNGSSGDGGTDDGGTDDGAAATQPAEPAADPSEEPSAEAPASNLEDACAYDAERAAEELAAGKPPTRNG